MSPWRCSWSTPQPGTCSKDVKGATRGNNGSCANINITLGYIRDNIAMICPNQGKKGYSTNGRLNNHIVTTASATVQPWWNVKEALVSLRDSLAIGGSMVGDDSWVQQKYIFFWIGHIPAQPPKDPIKSYGEPTGCGPCEETWWSMARRRHTDSKEPMVESSLCWFRSSEGPQGKHLQGMCSKFGEKEKPTSIA